MSLYLVEQGKVRTLLSGQEATLPLLITHGELLLFLPFPVLLEIQVTQTGCVGVCRPPPHSPQMDGLHPFSLRKSRLCCLAVCPLTDIHAMSYRPLLPWELVERVVIHCELRMPEQGKHATGWGGSFTQSSGQHPRGRHGRGAGAGPHSDDTLGCDLHPHASVTLHRCLLEGAHVAFREHPESC